MTVIDKGRPSTCLSEGVELQNGRLRVRFEKFAPNGNSIVAKILDPESQFDGMDDDQMTFHKVPLSHDMWASELSYPNKGCDRVDRVVVRSEIGRPWMLYVPNDSPEFS